MSNNGTENAHFLENKKKIFLNAEEVLLFLLHVFSSQKYIFRQNG